MCLTRSTQPTHTCLYLCGITAPLSLPSHSCDIPQHPSMCHLALCRSPPHLCTLLHSAATLSCLAIIMLHSDTWALQTSPPPSIHACGVTHTHRCTHSHGSLLGTHPGFPASFPCWKSEDASCYYPHLITNDPC